MASQPRGERRGRHSGWRVPLRQPGVLSMDTPAANQQPAQRSPPPLPPPAQPALGRWGWRASGRVAGSHTGARASGTVPASVPARPVTDHSSECPEEEGGGEPQDEVDHRESKPEPRFTTLLWARHRRLADVTDDVHVSYVLGPDIGVPLPAGFRLLRRVFGSY